jgi:hypothetical protein
MKKEILSIFRINIPRRHQKIYRNLGTRNTDARDPPSMTKFSLTGSHSGEKKHSIIKEQNG